MAWYNVLNVAGWIKAGSPTPVTTTDRLPVDTGLTTQTDALTNAQLRASPVPVSGTVTANQGGTWNINNITGTVSLPTGAATAANQTTANASLSSLDAKMPDESGAWGYNAGTTGTLNVAANKRILAISATAPALTGGSMTINGGQTITIPAGTSITITPKANLVAPTVVFTGTASYFVEFIE